MRMKRIFAYTLFWFTMGMLVMLILPNDFVGVLLIAGCLLASYYLFSCK